MPCLLAKLVLWGNVIRVNKTRQELGCILKDLNHREALRYTLCE